MNNQEVKTVSDLSKVPMSDIDIKKYLPNTRIITYADLAKAESIIDILPKKKDAVVLLFERKPDLGHWIALIREDKLILFFDPYGYRVDKFLQFTPENLRKELNQDIPHLTLLLNKAVDEGAKVIFNGFEFQNRAKMSTATCGRWVISIINYFASRKMPTLEKFKDLILKLSKSHGLALDLLISKLIP